jgi:redox-sensitive bicupin YhaK (pirin superfamily)
MAKSIEVTADRSRHFVHWTRGKLLVGITRSVSPSDSDENLQPFAFLDYFDTKGSSFSDFALRNCSNSRR